MREWQDERCRGKVYRNCGVRGNKGVAGGVGGKGSRVRDFKGESVRDECVGG